MVLPAADQCALEAACQRLENPSLAIRLSASIGVPVEAMIKRIGEKVPPELADAVMRATNDALEYV